MTVVFDGVNAAKDIMPAGGHEWPALHPTLPRWLIRHLFDTPRKAGQVGPRRLNSTFIDKEQRDVFDLDGFG